MKIFRRSLAALAAATVSFLLISGAASATPPDDLSTPADVIHPDIHKKVGQGDGTNANPNDANDNGGNIHGIANVPGQNADSVPGVANLANVHGGIATVNKNVE